MTLVTERCQNNVREWRGGVYEREATHVITNVRGNRLLVVGNEVVITHNKKPNNCSQRHDFGMKK